MYNREYHRKKSAEHVAARRATDLQGFLINRRAAQKQCLDKKRLDPTWLAKRELITLKHVIKISHLGWALGDEGYMMLAFYNKQPYMDKLPLSIKTRLPLLKQLSISTK